jgi:pimeloyl-ACP methyl ester carboxylesterase/DNA-binding CsgD family transcriptional regulator
VADLETVVDAAGVDRFTLIGVSAAAAIAVAYAVRHPERVERFISYGGFARGRAHRGEDARRRMEMLISVIGNGWTSPDPAFRRMFTMMFLPEGTPDQMAWYDELQRRSITPDDAVRLYQARGVLDVRDLVPQMRAKALVLHGTGDRVVPFEEGRLFASLLPNARLVPLESVNHVLLEAEPAWSEFLAEVNAFTGTTGTAPPSPVELPELSNRELDVLSCVALGLDNDEIAARLFISVRTVERHMSNIYVKLGVSGKAARAAAAARFARHAG